MDPKNPKYAMPERFKRLGLYDPRYFEQVRKEQVREDVRLVKMFGINDVIFDEDDERNMIEGLFVIKRILKGEYSIN